MINFATSVNSEEEKARLDAAEAGLGPTPLPPVDPNDRSLLPPNRAQWPVPPHLGFASIIGLAWRAHHHGVDEALKHSRSNADAMLKDILILTALEDRIRPVSQLSWHIAPEDETDNRQVKAAAKVTLAVSKTWKLQEFLHQLNYAKWYGKFGCELLWRWDDYQPDLLKISNWAPVNGDSLVSGYSFTRWGRLVNALYEGSTEPYSLGRCHWYTDDELQSVVIHTHRPRQPDYYDGISSGQLRGTGLRHGAYWMWYYRANLLALLFDYLERLSTGIWKGYYDQSNPEARQSLEQAVAGYKSKQMLSLPRNAQGYAPNDLEIMEVGAASPAIIRDAIAYIDGLLRSYILGRPDMTGNIGGDEVALQEGAISATTKADAVSLAEDLTANWLPTLYRYNSPGCPPGRFVFDVDHPNADKLLSYAQVMREMGWPVDLDHLAEVCGLPKASLDTTISTKIQPLTPTALESPPQGMPVAGNAPAPQQQVVQPTTTPQTLQELPA